MNKRSLPRLTAIVTALVAALMFPSVGHAQLPDPRSPVIQFDSRGETRYDFTQQILSVDASALTILLPGAPPALIQAATGTAGSPGCNPPSACGTLTVRARVDNSGSLVGGVDGPALTIVGKVLEPFSGNTIADGILLTGDVTEFFVGTEKFELRFSITGGFLKDFGFLHQCGEWGTTLCDLGALVGIALPAGSSLTPFTGLFTGDFHGGAAGAIGAIEPAPPALPPPPPPTPCNDPYATNYLGELPCVYRAPVVSGFGTTVEATGSTGAHVILNVTATDAEGERLPVICSPEPGTAIFPFVPELGTVIPVGRWELVCTSAPDRRFNTGSLTLVVIVQDTTPPTLIGSDVEVEADGAQGHSSVPLPVTATDLVDGAVAVVCDPASGSAFPIGSTPVMCTATDLAGNLATRINVGAPELAAYIMVTVKDNPPALPGGECFVVNFREITYFRGQSVITSWPYRASGGAGYTKSRGTEFRIYGFQPAELEQLIPNADDTRTTYPVQYDSESRGYYIDLGGPARVMICPDQLHEYVLAGQKSNGHRDGSTLLPLPQRNVPGIMLTHNTQIVNVPYRVRMELYQLGLYQAVRGMIDYIGFQVQGGGNSEFREFVDVEIEFAGDSETDRLQHYQFGFHTAINTNFETFGGCNYVDYAPGNDAVRLHDIWGPNRSKWQGYASWQACGSKEPSVNQKRRADYEVPFNAVQILPTVNTNTDTLRLFYGPIRPVPASETRKKDHKTDWAEWDRWDH